MSKAHILIIEDEKDIVKMLEYNFKKEGFKVSIARDGESGLALARKGSVDLALLDLMLPGIDGMEVCRALKEEKGTRGIPVIMVTAKSQVADKVLGLEFGADDYVTKPFSPRELIARVKAVLRRAKEKTALPDIFSTGDLAVDFSGVAVSVKGRRVEVTSKEFELLKELIKSRGRVLSRDHLLDAIWGLDQSLEVQTRTVDVHIRTLRKKLKSAAKHIVTVKNYGYRFEEEGEGLP